VKREQNGKNDDYETLAHCSASPQRWCPSAPDLGAR
jgi:hypothetical protein